MNVFYYFSRSKSKVKCQRFKLERTNLKVIIYGSHDVNILGKKKLGIMFLTENFSKIKMFQKHILLYSIYHSNHCKTA